MKNKKATGKQSARQEEEVKRKTLLNTKQVAHLLNCSPDDVIILAQRGQIPATKEGRFWRIRYVDALAYRDAHKLVANGG